MSDEKKTPAKTIKKRLMVKLTQAELVERGEQLVAKVTLHAAIDEGRKAAGKAFKDRMKAVAKEGKDLCRVIRDRVEERDVDVVAEPDYRAREMLYKHPKTGEVLDRRELLPNELQTELKAPVVSDPAPKDKAPKGKKKDPADAISAPPKKGATVSHLSSVPAAAADPEAV